MTYSTVINGRQWGHIKPSRCLRQRDLISPYLFLVAVEGLLNLIKNSVNEGKMKGFVAARNGPKVSNLFFADDCFIFCRAESNDCRELIAILRSYGRASGQEINVGKSSILYGKNIRDIARQSTMQILGIQRSLDQEKYLSLPFLSGRSKGKELRSIKERVWAKIQSWKERLLSQVGRAVMIQAVGQSIPLYAMSCFKLPRGFIHELNMMMASFW